MFVPGSLRWQNLLTGLRDASGREEHDCDLREVVGLNENCGRVLMAVQRPIDYQSRAFYARR
jgi:hypothetical protein